MATHEQIEARFAQEQIEYERTSIHPSGDLAVVVERLRSLRWRLDYAGGLYATRVFTAGDRYAGATLESDCVMLFTGDGVRGHVLSIEDVLRITSPTSEDQARPSCAMQQAVV